MNHHHPDWARTTDLELAAAVSVLGIRVEVDKTQDMLTGKGWKTLLLGLESEPIADIGGRIPGGEEPAPAPHFKADWVLSMLRSKRLAKAAPHHPCLDVLRACAARTALIDAAKTGARYCLRRVTGVQRFKLVAGEEPQAIKQARLLWRTRDIRLAAALSILGAPLARIEAEGDRHAFVFSQLAYGLDQPPIVPSDLAQAWRTKRLEQLEPEHPLLWMMQGLINRDAIEDHVRDQRPVHLIRAPGTGRAALVREGISDRQMDKTRRFLGIA